MVGRLPITAYLAVLTAIAIAVTFFTPETIGRDPDDPRDATRYTGSSDSWTVVNDFGRITRNYSTRQSRDYQKGTVA